MGEGGGRAGNHRGVEAEEQSAERADERASENVAVQRHGSLPIKNSEFANLAIPTLLGGQLDVLKAEKAI